MSRLNRMCAQESSHAIQRMYITMRHLFSRGFYKPMGVSGSTLHQAFLSSRPEIYASDNPLEMGSTLASGGLGLSGGRPTYVNIHQILKQILN